MKNWLINAKRRLNQIKIARSGYFDGSFYLSQYPDVVNSRWSALQHFERFGTRERRLPSLIFDTANYLLMNPAARLSDNPVLDWMRHRGSDRRVPPRSVTQSTTNSSPKILGNDPRTEVSSYPLIVFVHVPKTAGSSLKKFLNIHTPRGVESVEQIIEKTDKFRGIVRQADWISGHLSIDVLVDGLHFVDRPVEYYSIIRSPIDQLISHLNYSIHRSLFNDYYNEHNENERLIDAEVADIDFLNPDSIISFLLKNHEIYLNIQSRLIIGKDFSEIRSKKIINELKKYTYIADMSNSYKIYKSFGFAQASEQLPRLRENVAKRYIDPIIFDSPRLKDFLSVHHGHDLQLYASYRRASWPAEGRVPFRPAFLGQNTFTYENFDEQAYLYSNPDVAAAVGSRDLESGFKHFCAYGHREGRMNRQWLFIP